MKHETTPPITSRIFLELENKKITQSELARKLNIRQSTICGWKQRNNEPEAELLEHIAKALNVSIEWLITGNESKQEILPKEQQLLLDYFNQCNQEGKNRIMEQAEFIATKYPKKEESLNCKIG